MKYVLFVCTQNAGRSQMAQAFFERHGPPDLRAESAGAEPADSVHPVVVEAMHEVGIDLAERRPKKLTVEMQLHADWAITLACGAKCPYVPSVVRTGTSTIPPASRSRTCAGSGTTSSSVSAPCSKRGSIRSARTGAST